MVFKLCHSTWKTGRLQQITMLLSMTLQHAWFTSCSTTDSHSRIMLKCNINSWVAHCKKAIKMSFRIWQRFLICQWQIREDGNLEFTTLIKQRWLKLFGHVARLDQAEDHNCALRASLNPASNWRWPRRCPRQTWLQTINDDLKHVNRGLHSAYSQVQDRPLWQKTVETAMLT